MAEVNAPHERSKRRCGLIQYGKQELLLKHDERRGDMEGNIQHMPAVTRPMDIIEAEMKSDSFGGKS